MPGKFQQKRFFFTFAIFFNKCEVESRMSNYELEQNIVYSFQGNINNEYKINEVVT